MTEPAPPIFRLTPSPVRRWLGVGMTGTLGALIEYLAFSASGMAAGWQLFLIAAGALALFGAVRLWQATAFSIELTEAGLHDTSGRPIAGIAEIVSVDRGSFAFKPSNGFLLRLKTAAPRAWAPGLWWRIGRSVGVGGVTNRDEARLMADLLSKMLAERPGSGV